MNEKRLEGKKKLAERINSMQESVSGLLLRLAVALACAMASSIRSAFVFKVSAISSGDSSVSGSQIPLAIISPRNIKHAYLRFIEFAAAQVCVVVDICDFVRRLTVKIWRAGPPCSDCA